MYIFKEKKVFIATYFDPITRTVDKNIQPFDALQNNMEKVGFIKKQDYKEPKLPTQLYLKHLMMIVISILKLIIMRAEKPLKPKLNLSEFSITRWLLYNNYLVISQKQLCGIKK